MSIDGTAAQSPGPVPTTSPAAASTAGPVPSDAVPGPHGTSPATNVINDGDQSSATRTSPQSPVPSPRGPVPGPQSSVPGSQSPVPGPASPQDWRLGPQSSVPGPGPRSWTPVPSPQSPAPVAVDRSGPHRGNAAGTINKLDADLEKTVRRTSYMRQLFYVVVLLTALAGQVSGAVQALGIPLIWAIPAVGALELGGIVVLANADVRRRLGEKATASRILSAAIAAFAVAFNWMAHDNKLLAGFFAGMSALGYLVWLMHTENQRRDRLRARGDLPPTAPAYEVVGHWMRHPWMTLRAKNLAKADPRLGLYTSIAAAQAEKRKERRTAAIAKVLYRKIRSAVDPDTADIAVAVYDLDIIAKGLADGADYQGLTSLIAADLAPARLTPGAALPAVRVEQAQSSVPGPAALPAVVTATWRTIPVPALPAATAGDQSSVPVPPSVPPMAWPIAPAPEAQSPVPAALGTEDRTTVTDLESPVPPVLGPVPPVPGPLPWHQPPRERTGDRGPGTVREDSFPGTGDRVPRPPARSRGLGTGVLASAARTESQPAERKLEEKVTERPVAPQSRASVIDEPKTADDANESPAPVSPSPGGFTVEGVPAEYSAAANELVQGLVEQLAGSDTVNFEELYLFRGDLVKIAARTAYIDATGDLSKSWATDGPGLKRLAWPIDGGDWLTRRDCLTKDDARCLTGRGQAYANRIRRLVESIRDADRSTT